MSTFTRSRGSWLGKVTAVVAAAALVFAPAAPAHAGIFDAFSSGSSGAVTGGNTTGGRAPIATWNAPLGPAPAYLRDNYANGLYDNDVDWAWLKNSPTLRPGVGLINTSTSTRACSAGWIFNNGNRPYVSTAGHCGLGPEGQEPTSPYVYALERGTSTKVRTVGVQETHRYNNSVLDYALIQVYDTFLSGKDQDGNTVVNIDPTIPSRGPVLSGLTQVDKPLNPDVLEAGNTWLCHLGRASGLACGKFKGVNRHGMLIFDAKAARGDSGGPVFAVDDKHIYPVGILSSGQNDNEGVWQLLVQPIVPVMNTQKNLYWGMP